MLIFMMSGRANQKLILSVWNDRPGRVSSGPPAKYRPISALVRIGFASV